MISNPVRLTARTLGILVPFLFILQSTATGLPLAPPLPPLPPPVGGVAQNVTNTVAPAVCPPACGALPSPDRIPPAFPKPPTGNLLESVIANDTAIPADTAHDWDGDGIPDGLDAVNLPSEAKTLTSPSDLLSMPDGLPVNGLAVLIEPSHHEAQFIAADPTKFLQGSSAISVAQALDEIELLQGVQARNAFAMVINSGMKIHFLTIQPESALNLSLTWANPNTPADGSWLLVNTDPTRIVELTLGGSLVDVTARATSHYSGTGLTDWRWQFLNLHSGLTFCYDPATNTTATACQGYDWPGWIRAYSGQAAYALSAVRSGLASGTIPLTTTPSIPNPAPIVSGAASICTTGIVLQLLLSVEACIPTCSSGVSLTPLCIPNVGGPCPGGSIGIALTELTCIKSCPDDSIDPPIGACIPSVSNCEAGSIGAILSGWSLCLHDCPRNQPIGLCIPNVPNTDPCPPGTVGENDPPLPCLPQCVPGTLIGICIPTYATCPLPQIGLIYNGQTLCTLPPEQGSPQSAPAATPASSSSFHQSLPLLPAGSKWHFLGNQSYAFPTGIGTDYMLDPAGPEAQASWVTQVASLTDANAPTALRHFKFQGGYYKTPATPRDFTRISLGIESTDGNHTAQAFVIDGKRLTQLLELRSGDTLNVTVDDAHKAGFQYTVRDINGDGIQDLIVLLPHFSEPWLYVTPNKANGDFWHAYMTGTDQGWVVGTNSGAAVYRYGAGGLDRYDISGTTTTQQAEDMYVLDDGNFYVVGTGDCNSGRGPFIAHYHSATIAKNAFQLMRVPISDCTSPLTSIWMKSDETLGYAGGGNGVWLKYTPTTGWISLGSGTQCGLRAISFDSSGTGYVSTRGVGSPCNNSVTSGVLRWDGTSFTAAADSTVPNNIMGFTGPWAAGFVPGSDSSPQGPGVYHLDSQWRLSTEAAPHDSFMGVARLGTTDSYWFAGYSLCGSARCGVLANRLAGAWSIYQQLPSGTPQLNGLSFLDQYAGIAVGMGGTILQFQDYAPPVALGSLSGGTDTMTLVTANGAASSQAQGHALLHDWSWGDLTSSTGTAPSHRYNAAGTYTIEHVVTDQVTHQRSATHTLTVTITATPITLGGSLNANLPASSSTVGHAFVLASSGADRYVKLSLSGPAYVSAAIDAPPLLGTTSIAAGGSWPTQDSVSSTSLSGKVRSGHSLYVSVQVPAGGSGASYTLSSATVGAPGAPQTGFTAGTYAPVVGFTATTTSGERPTQLVVDWGDGATLIQPTATTYQGPTSYSPSHTYTVAGPHTIAIKTQDDLGQVAPVTRAITVYLDPTGVSLAPSNVGAGQATLNGRLDSLGGAPSVTATFNLYNQGNLVASNAQTRSGTGTFSWTASGLTSGLPYTYTVVFTNTVTSVTSATQAFGTAASLAITPTINSGPGTVSLGSASSLSLQAGSSDPNQVAYYVVWAPGAIEVRYPTTGYLPWNQAVSASTTMAFPGTYAGEVRLTDTSGARSSPVTFTTTVTGGSPVGSFASTSQLDTVTLTTTTGSRGVSPTNLRFGLQDPVTHDWSISDWFTNPSGAITWTSPTLDRSKTYNARIELSAADGSGWLQSWTTPTGNQLSVQTNRAPTFRSANTPSVVNYLDGTRFSIIYRDAEGDAPVAPPTLTVNGASYAMYQTVSTTDFKVGVEYHYNLPVGVLPLGRSSTPTYQVTDQYNRVSSYQDGAVFVDKPYEASLNFEGDTADGLPQGMTLGGTLDYWHVADTQASNMPGRVASGHHGKALWFGDKSRGTYQDPNGGAPRGTAALTVDLRALMHPSLSFSSYYETEDLGYTYDVKIVQACIVSCSNDGNWNTLLLVGGYEGGFGAWRTQHADLSGYAGQIVQVRFLFDAKDKDDNNHLGWIIDDITIGHDQDSDTLPDQLEKTRNDVLVSNQILPVHVDALSSATSYVRRLIRPQTDIFQLEALVGTKAPSQVNVWVGVAPTASDPNTHSFQIYANGADQTGCVSTTSNGIETDTRYAIITKSDGVDIRLDIVNCGAVGANIPASVLAQSRDWFLTVQTTSSREAWIEMLRIVSSGHTNFLALDTNHDGESDGTKVNYGKDALGYDADQDGIPRQVDSNDLVPNWAPALKVSSQDYSKRMELEFKDNLAPIAGITVQAKVNATGQSKTLSLNYGGGTSWAVNPGEGGGPLPDVLIADWRDVYGTAGTLNLYLTTRASGHYLPSGVQWRAQDAVSALPVAFGAGFEAAAESEEAGFTLCAPAAATGPGEGVCQGIALTASIAVGVYAAYQVWQHQAAIQFLTQVIVAETNHAASEHTACLAASFCFNYEEGRVASLAAAAGLQTAAVMDTINNVGGTDNIVEIPGDIHRLIRDIGGTLVVIVVIGGEKGEIDKVWQWPTELGNPAAPAIGYLVKKELEYANAHHHGHENDYEVAAKYATKDTSNSVCPELITLSTIDRTTGATDVEVPVPLPCSLLQIVREAYAKIDTEEQLASTKTAVDTAITTLGYDAVYVPAAKNNLLKGKVHWYWDNNPSTDADCSTTPPPDARRCIDHALGTSVQRIAWRAIAYNLPHKVVQYADFIDPIAMYWNNAGRQVYTDGVDGKGFMEKDLTNYAGGRDAWLWVSDDLGLLPKEPWANADVKIPFVVLDAPKGAHSFVAFNQ